jgi:hypothetical protein
LCLESAYIDVTADRTTIKWQIGRSNKSRRLCALNHIALQHYRTAPSAGLITTTTFTPSLAHRRHQ